MRRPGIPGLRGGGGGGPAPRLGKKCLYKGPRPSCPAFGSPGIQGRPAAALQHREPELGSGGCEDPVGSWAWFSWTLAGLSPACYVPPVACTARDRVSLQSGWVLELPDPRELSFSCPGAGSLPGGALSSGSMPGACVSFTLHQLLKHLEFHSGLSGSVVLKTCGAAC